MKKLVFLLPIFLFRFVWAQAPSPDFNDKMATGERLAHQKSAAFTESDDFADYDLVYQRLNFTVDPTVNFIAGSVYSKVKFLKDQVSSIRFDLLDNMIVDSVNCNQIKTNFQHSGDKISISLPLPMAVNSLSNFEVFYHGAPFQDGFGSFTVSTHNNAPELWTLSEPYGAKNWWPCKQSLADKIDSMDVYITCPSQYKAASNGKLISDQVVNNLRTAHWKHRYPIATYLVGIAVTNYETYSDFLNLPGGKTIEVLNYVYPEYLSTAKTKSADILNILGFYNSKFVTYPFASEKYGHAQFGWGGGMEHQTMSFMTTLDFELVAHEMAHQWFGDDITLASWHDIWMNEGFATYLTGLCYENLLNGQYWQAWKKIQVEKITSVPDGSVYVADTTDINRVFDGRLSYSKGAYLLQMLRWEMGDSLFFKGMKNYLNDQALSYGFATQEQFVRHMETAADTTLTEFFTEWYYGQGYPVYHLTYFHDPANPARQKLRISQSTSNPSVAFFKMHVPVRVWKDGQYSDLRLYNTQQDQEFVIPEDRIDSIQFDPGLRLCARADQVLPVKEIAQIGQIQIIPENSTNRVRVLVPDFSGKAGLRIFDLNGKPVFVSSIQAGNSSVGFGNLANGIYLVEVQSGNQKKTQKIVINH